MCNCINKSAFKEDFDGKIEKKVENWADLKGIVKHKARLDEKYSKWGEETDEKEGFLDDDCAILVKKDRKNTNG